MKYSIPFQLRNKMNNITVDYKAMENPEESGFGALNVPFDVNQCIGYPMIHAYFDDLNLQGYERYCGFIQIMRWEEYNTVDGKESVNVRYELDCVGTVSPYFCVGYPAELFDAPCNNLRGSEKLVWTAYTYLVDPPSRMNGNQLTFLAGFSWGYVENTHGIEGILDFKVLSEKDWEEHKKYIEQE